MSLEPSDIWRGSSVGDYGSAAVGSADVVMLASGDDNRRCLLVENLGPDVLFVGFDEEVTIATGTGVDASGALPYQTPYTGPVFGISAGSADVRLQSVGAPLQAEE